MALKNNYKMDIKSLHIYPKYIYCTDIHDDLFSTIVFEVGYTKTDDNDYKSALVLSDSMIMNTEDYLSLQTRNLQEKYPQLSVLEIDNNKFKKLMKKIHDYKVDQLQPTIEPMKPKASVQDLLMDTLRVKERIKMLSRLKGYFKRFLVPKPDKNYQPKRNHIR